MLDPALETKPTSPSRNDDSPASDGYPSALRRPLVALRPWGFALGFLVVAEVVLRLTLPPDARLLRHPLQAQACMADDGLDALAAARSSPERAGAPTWDVVLVGDSVLGSVNNPSGERLHDYLDQHLRARGIPARIHNLSAGGAHAGDQYGALLRLHRTLSAQPLGLDKLLLVLSVNPIFFSRRQSQPPLSFPCLFDELDEADPALSRDLRRRLGLSRPAGQLQKHLASGLTNALFLYQQRRRLGEAVFGAHDSLHSFLHAQLRRLHRPRQSVPRHDNRPWFAQGLSPDRFRPSYDFIPLLSREALNAELTTQLARWLSQHRELTTLVEQMPQNHFLVGAFTSAPAYQQLAQHVASELTQAGLAFRSHDRARELVSEHFTDLDHLTAAGNAALSALIADDIAEVLATAANR